MTGEGLTGAERESVCICGHVAGYSVCVTEECAEHRAEVERIVASRVAAALEGAGTDFADWLASNVAYNGGGDRGQRFYDDGWNPWLYRQSVEWARARTTAPSSAEQPESGFLSDLMDQQAAQWDERHGAAGVSGGDSEVLRPYLTAQPEGEAENGGGEA